MVLINIKLHAPGFLKTWCGQENLADIQEFEILWFRYINCGWDFQLAVTYSWYMYAKYQTKGQLYIAQDWLGKYK